MLSQKEIFGITRNEAGSNDVVAISMSLVRFTGSWTAGAILSQLLYWSDKTRIKGGYVCKTHEEWNTELMLSRDKVRPAVALLKKGGILEVKIQKFDGTPKPHYKIIEQVFREKFAAYLKEGILLQSENPTVGKPDEETGENSTEEPTENRGSNQGKSNDLITETNTDITTETNTEKKETPPEGAAGSGPDKNKWEGTGSEEEKPTYVSGQPKKEEEKDSAQKEEEEEEEVSQREWEKRYNTTWWEFYKKQTGEKPPNSWRNHYTIGGPLKKIQQDLAAVFEGCEESGYQEFVSILNNWPKLRDYHRHRLQPLQIHKSLSEIRSYIHEYTDKGQGNTEKIPVLGEAVELFREAHLALRGIPANTNGKAPEHLAGVLHYLKDSTTGNTWESALKGFHYILSKWPELEKQDSFYKDNFTLSYINGNTARIITAIKGNQQRQPDLSVSAAAAWLATNGPVR